MSLRNVAPSGQALSQRVAAGLQRVREAVASGKLSEASGKAHERHLREFEEALGPTRTLTDAELEPEIAEYLSGLSTGRAGLKWLR